MFKLMSKDREDKIRKSTNIYYFIKKEWMPVSMMSKFATPYNVYLIPNDRADNSFEHRFLYTCYMNVFEDALEINNLKYTEWSRRLFFAQPDFDYLCLTLAIEKAISLAKIKNKDRLIFSSNINHTIEILLDYNFENLYSSSEINYQKGILLLNNSKKEYANN